MKILGFFAALMLAVAAHGQGTANPGGGGGMNFIAPSPTLSPSSASNSFVLINNGAATNLNVNVLTNQGGFFMGGNGTFGTNNSGSTLTVNMGTVFTSTISNNLVGSSNYLSIPIQVAGIVSTSGTARTVLQLRRQGAAANRAVFFAVDSSDGWYLQTVDGATFYIGQGGSTTVIRGNGNWQGATGGNNFTMGTSTLTLGSDGSALSKVKTATASLVFPAQSTIGEVTTNTITLTGMTNGGGSVAAGWPDTLPTDSVWRMVVTSTNLVSVYRTALGANAAYTNTFRATYIGF